VTIGRETVVNRRIVKNTGVNGGFAGCIKSLKMSSADQIHVYNFTLDQSSTDLLKYSDIGTSRLSSCTLVAVSLLVLIHFLDKVVH